ncbi:DNA-binding protein [Methyloprofundus sp.]|uniref:DNA-binding protein n=1 Tax=Methyloprofundus sp. TaxID=2020875 RepID=UPI003D0AA9A2
MQEYEFTLKFKFPDASITPDSYVDHLGAGGCDDALIGVGQQGRIALNFNRQAESALNAVCSAIEDVKRVIPDAVLIEATPDFVGLSDIADVLGFSRQNMRNLMMNNSISFPLPIHEGRSAIWHLSTVLSWCREGNRYQIDDSIQEVAEANMQLNIAKEITNIDPLMSPRISTVL